MSNAIATIDQNAIRKVILHGDLSGLTPDQKDSYYMKVCETVGLNPLTKPFEFIKFQGKEIMYSNKGCAEQLRMIHKIGLKVVSKEKIEDIYIVTTEAVDRDGRTDSATGAVNVAGLKGDNLANAFMKAETKSKRRVTLSICGLNMLDESEVETFVPEMKSSEKIAAPVENPLIKHRQEQAEVEYNIGNYVIPFGKFKNQKLRDVDMFQLDSYLKWVLDSAKDSGKEIKGNVKDFVDNTQAYLCSLEGPAESSKDLFPNE